MKIEQSLSELRHLGKAARDSDARDRVSSRIFQHAADEVAHVDERGFGKTVQLLNRRLGSRPGGAGDVLEAARACHVDAAVDRVDPGRTGIGYDDPGRPQDRKSANNAEARIERSGGERFSTGNREFDNDVAGGPEELRHLANSRSHHLARHRIDRGFTGRDGEARFGHRSHAFTRDKGDAGTRRTRSHRRLDQGAMRDVGIVAGILHDPGGRTPVKGFENGNRKADARPVGKPYLDGIRTLTGYQRLVRGARGGSRASTRGPAAPERLAGSFLIRVCGVVHILLRSGGAKPSTISP